jgi:predicted O-methyltransferase YrrM
MVMYARVVGLAGVAAAAAIAVYVVPPHAASAALVGLALLAVGIYVLRERAALRGVRSAIRGVAAAQSRLANQVAELARAQAESAVTTSSELADVAKGVQRVRDLSTELAGLHAAASSDLRTRNAALAGSFSQGVEALGQGVEALGHGVEALRDGLSHANSRLDHAATQTEMRRLHGESAAAAITEFRQVEALANLHAVLPLRAPLPQSRRWAASPDLLAHLVSIVEARRPKLIVEFGGGLSTICLAYAVEKVDTGKIISIDHDERFAARTRAQLELHALSGLVDVRSAPLVDLDLDGEIWPWYDQRLLKDVEGCDLLIVDGPPAAVRVRARYPALPVMVGRLAEDAVVILDDCIREDESSIAESWTAQNPGWTFEMIEHEKRTAMWVASSQLAGTT